MRQMFLPVAYGALGAAGLIVLAPRLLGAAGYTPTIVTDLDDLVLVAEGGTRTRNPLTDA